MFAVVRIAVGEDAIATGFFASLPDATKDWFLVTCSHVLDDLAPDATLVIHGPGHGGIASQFMIWPLAVAVPTSVSAWRRFDDIDVAILRLPMGHPVTSMLRVVAFHPAHFPTHETLERLFAVEEITMVGCPYGYWDSVHGFPIFRRGITASHPAIDHSGKAEGLVDVASFPGSSGSPVLVLNEGIIPVKTDARIAVKGNPRGPGISAGQRMMLLGMLTSAPHYVAAGHLEGVDGDIGIRPVQHHALHLGVYVKARVILDAIGAVAAESP